MRRDPSLRCVFAMVTDAATAGASVAAQLRGAIGG